MKQRVTRELFDYWDALRRDRVAPARADIDPAAIRTCLPDIFILTFDPDAGHPFRIAGTAICTMFGRELAGIPFAWLWPDDSRDLMHELVQQVAEGCGGMIATGWGCNAEEEESVPFEMMLLPLTCADGPCRLIGSLTSTTTPYWLGVRSLRTLRLESWRPARSGTACSKAGLSAHDGKSRRFRFSRNYQG